VLARAFSTRSTPHSPSSPRWSRNSSRRRRRHLALDTAPPTRLEAVTPARAVVPSHGNAKTTTCRPPARNPRS